MKIDMVTHYAPADLPQGYTIMIETSFALATTETQTLLNMAHAIVDFTLTKKFTKAKTCLRYLSEDQ